MSDPSQQSSQPLSLTLMAERINFSISGICRVVQRHKITPVLIIGTAKYYSPEQAEQIAVLMRPNAKSRSASPARTK